MLRRRAAPPEQVANSNLRLLSLGGGGGTDACLSIQSRDPTPCSASFRSLRQDQVRAGVPEAGSGLWGSLCVGPAGSSPGGLISAAEDQSFHYGCPSMSESCWSCFTAPTPKPLNSPFGTKSPGRVLVAAPTGHRERTKSPPGETLIRMWNDSHASTLWKPDPTSWEQLLHQGSEERE